MSGGANFSPQVLIEGKRPFDRYRPSSEVLPEIASRYLLSPVFPILVTIVMRPWYEAASLWWRHSDPWGLGECGFVTIGFAILSSVSYVVGHGFFAIIEKNGWLEQYKIERREFQLPSRELILGTLKQSLFSYVVSMPLLSYFLLVPFFKRIGSPNFDALSPSCSELYFTFMVAIFCTDFGFYWVHRCLHTKLLYKFHKKHHEWHGNISIAAEYNHPIDTFLSNILPTLLGCVLMRAHFLTLLAWIFVRKLKAFETHSGYAFHFQWLHLLGVVNWDNAVAHDYHHSANCGNFGVYWIDWVFGTMDSMMVKGGLERYFKSLQEDNLAHPRILGRTRTQVLPKVK